MTRHYGEGSVFQRSDGRWCAKVTDPATGKSSTRYAKDESSARKLLLEMSRRAAAGAPVSDKRMTLKKYSQEWLSSRAGRRRSESTLYEYESRLERHIYPSLGALKLSSLTIPRVEAWLDELLEKGLSPSTVAAIRNTLAAVLSDAVKQRHLAVNVARLAEMPFRGEVSPVKVTPPTVGSTRKLLELADKKDPEIGRFLRVIASTGCRIGELSAARWVDVDLERGLWRVERTITRDRQGRSKVGETTKSREAREVKLPSSAVEALLEQRRDVRKRQLAAPVWVDEAFVWPTSIGTAPDVHNVRKRIRAVATEAGFDGSAHSLRHLFASIAAESFELTIVAKLLGHKRVSTTSDLYAHLRPETRDGVADVVESAISGEL